MTDELKNSTQTQMKQILCELQKIQVKCFERGLKFDITMIKQEPCESINVTIKDHGEYRFFNFYTFYPRYMNKKTLCRLRNLLNI